MAVWRDAAEVSRKGGGSIGPGWVAPLLLRLAPEKAPVLGGQREGDFERKEKVQTHNPATVDRRVSRVECKSTTSAVPGSGKLGG